MNRPRIEKPNSSELAWIQENIKLAQTLIASTGECSPASLASLDEAYAAWVELEPSDHAEINSVINAVGAYLGQCLVNVVGFKWIVATDEHGAELAILALPGKGDVIVYPANLVAKRWESKEVRFLATAFDQISRNTADVAAKKSSSRPS